MVTAPKSLDESYPAATASVPAVRRAVAELASRAGATPPQLDAIRLAVSEAVTNAVLHAYRRRAGEVHVTAAVVARELWVLVADDGCGFQTPAESPGLGWGLALIADATDDFAITQRGGGGTETRLRFGIGQSSIVAHV